MRLPWSRCPREPSPEQTLSAPGAGPQVPRRLSAPRVEECERGWRKAELEEGRGEERRGGFLSDHLDRGLTWTGGAGRWGMVPAAEPHAAPSPWASVVGWELAGAASLKCKAS